MELTKYISAENLLNMLSINDVDLTSDEKMAIFVIGNEDYNKLINVVISEVINSNNKFTYILDNFDSLNKIMELGDLLEEDNKIFIISRNIDSIKEKYGKYIEDKFDEVKIIENEENLEELGNYDKYPTIQISKNSYFNLDNIL